MEQNNTYKYLSLILAIIAIVFAVLYFTKAPEPVTETVSDVSMQIEECRTNIASWQAQYGNNSSSAEAQGALEDILADCEDTIGEAQEQI